MRVVSEVDVIDLIKGVPKLIRARRILNAVAPRVCDKLFSKCMEQLLENVGESLASAATAHFVGRTLGRLGRHVPGQLWQTMKDIAVWATTSVTSRLVSLAGLAARLFNVLAIEMKKELIKLNIVVSEADAEVMAREMLFNKQFLQSMELIRCIEPKD